MIKHRRFSMSFFILFGFLAFSLSGISYQKEELKMKVGIFQIPPYQSIIKSEPSPPEKAGVVGGIRGTKTGGYVTRMFPDGIVIFETDKIQNNKDLFEIIKERVNFPEITGILPIADVYFLINTEKLDASVIKEEMYPPRHRHLMREFSLHFIPISIEEKQTVISVKFSVQTDNRVPDKKKLFDHTFGIPYSRTLLVGFPTNDETGRGTVYWLAFTKENSQI
jgi:hypothetical protein